MTSVENKDAGIAAGAGHARHGGDFVSFEQIGRHGDDRDGQSLVRETAEAEQRQRRVRALDKPDERHARHQAGADGERAAAGVDQADAAFLQERNHHAAEHAAEIGGEKRQPGEQRDVLQIKMPDLAQIERQPERQRAPGRIGQKARQGDAPEIALLQNGPDRRPRSVALQMLLLARR